MNHSPRQLALTVRVTPDRADFPATRKAAAFSSFLDPAAYSCASRCGCCCGATPSVDQGIFGQQVRVLGREEFLRHASSG